MAKSKRKIPWKRAAPKKAGHTKLTPAGKAAARKKAKRAGRHYPNLVDNMRAAKNQKARRRNSD
jgi:hypothetical protein